ncbi:MAG TPA: sigma-70 family RNA polymerase sigma factor, partial [Polyangiales bacterium]
MLSRHGVAERELEDACQEVFLVVHTNLPEFEGRSRLRTWIYGIAVRMALGFRRKAYRVREQLPGELPEAGCSADQLELAERQQTLTLLDQALARLPAIKREVFALYERVGAEACAGDRRSRSGTTPPSGRPARPPARVDQGAYARADAEPLRGSRRRAAAAHAGAPA